MAVRLEEERDDPARDDAVGVAALRRRHSRRTKVVAALLALCFLTALAAPFFSIRARFILRRIPAIRAEHISVTEDRLRAAEQVVRDEVARRGFPGGALAVGERGRVLMEVGVGRATWSRLSLPVDADATLYDLSSVTKLMTTTTAVMLLVDEGKMRLDDPVARWLPAFRREGWRGKITIRHLLTHTAGLPAAREVHGSTPRARLNHLMETVPVLFEPGEEVLYSDVGFTVLGEAVERAAGEPMHAFLRRRVWVPLGMNATRYQPGRGCRPCAPTLTLEGGDDFAGKTNDPFARELGGVTGGAGLFSTAHDVARFAAMLANGGKLDGVRIIREATVRQFARPQPGAGTRGLGFEVFCQEGTVPDHRTCKTPYAYGHTGYTGTSIWIDPRRGVWVVLLTNRTYLPRAPNRMRVIRRRLFNLVTGTAVAPAKVQADTAPETR